MAATEQDEGDGLISAINVTPLVDIFLVLLVIFMATASLFLEKERRLREIPVTLPAAYSGNSPENRILPVSVVLDRLGRVWLDGKQVDMEAVGRAIDERRARGTEVQAVVSADKDLPYGLVARLIDFMRLHGVANLAVNVEEQTIWPEGQH